MALGSQKPSMALISGSLGNSDWLRDAIIEKTTYWRANGHLYIALFAGRRPSREEIQNNSYIFSGNNATYSFIGVMPCLKHGSYGYASPVVLNPKPEHMRIEGEGLQENSAYYPMASDDAQLSSDSNDIVNMVFPKGYQTELLSTTNYSNLEPNKYMALDGENGHGATWGLVCFGTSTKYTLNDILHTDAATDSNRRSYVYLGNEANNVVYQNNAQATSDYMFYITVGDVIDEPDANLVLLQGAEKGLTSYGKFVMPTRLHIRMNDLITNARITNGL